MFLTYKFIQTFNILANLQHLASLPTKTQQNIEEEKKIRYNKEMLEASLNQMVNEYAI